MRLTERDLKILGLLHKLRVLDIETLYELADFTRYNKCADRMAILTKSGYVKYQQYYGSVKKYFTITQKGMNILYPREEKTTKDNKKVYIAQKKPPTIKFTLINHEITVAKALLHLLKCNEELTVDDFKSDRDMMMSMDYHTKMKTQHFCDLICDKYRTKVEVELSPKKKDELSKNFYLNGNGYVQIWIVSSNLLYNRLNEFKKMNSDYTVEIIKVEDLNIRHINLAKLHEKLFVNNLGLKEEIEHLKRLEKKRAEQLSMFEENLKD